MQKKISKWFQNTNNYNKNHKSNNSQEITSSKKEDYDLKLAIEASLALAEEEKRRFQKDMNKSMSLDNDNTLKKIKCEDNQNSTVSLDSLPNNNNLQPKENNTLPNNIKQMNVIDANNKLKTPILPKVEAEFTWKDVEAFVKDVTTFGFHENSTSKNKKISQHNNNSISRNDHEYISTNKTYISESDNSIDQLTQTNKLIKGDWHDEGAEKLFFGQFNRETWNKNDIIKAHKENKKRSMSSAVKDNNKRLKLNRVSQERSYNYYNTSDEIIEDSFEESGFGSSLTSLSYEGVGQSRYA